MPDDIPIHFGLLQIQLADVSGNFDVEYQGAIPKFPQLYTLALEIENKNENRNSRKPLRCREKVL